MKISPWLLLLLGIFAGLGFDAWFSQLLEITRILFAEIGPKLYAWVPSKTLIPPQALTVFAWWAVSMLMILGTVSAIRYIWTPSQTDSLT